MFYLKAEGLPWHGLGTEVDEAPDSAAAIQLAGLDYYTRAVPAMALHPNPAMPPVVSPNRVLIQREDTGHIVGAAKQGYEDSGLSPKVAGPLADLQRNRAATLKEAAGMPRTTMPDAAFARVVTSVANPLALTGAIDDDNFMWVDKWALQRIAPGLDAQLSHAAILALDEPDADAMPSRRRETLYTLANDPRGQRQLAFVQGLSARDDEQGKKQAAQARGTKGAWAQATGMQGIIAGGGPGLRG